MYQPILDELSNLITAQTAPGGHLNGIARVDVGVYSAVPWEDYPRIHIRLDGARFMVSGRKAECAIDATIQISSIMDDRADAWAEVSRLVWDTATDQGLIPMLIESQTLTADGQVCRLALGEANVTAWQEPGDRWVMAAQVPVQVSTWRMM